VAVREAVIKSLVKDYLKRSNHLKLSRRLNSEPCLDLQGLTLEDMYNYFKPSKTFNGKTYEDFIPIREAFEEFESTLDTREQVVDQLVKAILQSGSQIRCINILYAFSSLSLKQRGNSRHECPKVNTNRLTKSEKKTITDKWTGILLHSSLISDSELILQELSAIQRIKGEKKEVKWKLTVIGSYLSQDFDYVRHSGQIVKHLLKGQRFIDTSGEPYWNTDIQAKSYIELVSLKSTFHQHIGDLRPLESEMDKIVMYILLKNVQTFYLNLIVTASQLREDPSIRQKYPKIKFGRFTSCKGGEKEVTSKAWSRLMIKAKIKEHQKVSEDILELKSRRGTGSTASKWRLVVIGSYLSRSLPTIRHAVEVLTVTLNSIYPKHNIGSFTIEEDELILKEVEKHGAIPDTWHTLRIKLNRLNRTRIARRYEIIANRNCKKSGHWNLIECKSLIDCIFPKANLKTVEYINNITARDIINSGAFMCINRTDSSIRKHWETFLKSILLRFHYGRLSTPWKYKFLKYLVKNQIMGQQEINFDQVTNIFPGIVSGLVGSWVPCIDVAGQFKGEPLFKIAQAAMPRYKNRPDCGKTALQFREEIIKHYSENI
jgi:hypothetical protein